MVLPIIAAGVTAASVVSSYLYGKYSGSEDETGNNATDKGLIRGTVSSVNNTLDALSYGNTFKLIAVAGLAYGAYYFVTRKLK